MGERIRLDGVFVDGSDYETLKRLAHIVYGLMDKPENDTERRRNADRRKATVIAVDMLPMLRIKAKA
jgi:hypothetical protein